MGKYIYRCSKTEWCRAMGHSPIQQKNYPLTTEIAILKLEKMTHWNFNFIGKIWKMAHSKPRTCECRDLKEISGELVARKDPKNAKFRLI